MMPQLKFDLSLEEQFEKRTMILSLNNCSHEQLLELATGLIDLHYQQKSCIKQLSKQSLGLC